MLTIKILFNLNLLFQCKFLFENRSRNIFETLKATFNINLSQIMVFQCPESTCQAVAFAKHGDMHLHAVEVHGGIHVDTIFLDNWEGM